MVMGIYAIIGVELFRSATESDDINEYFGSTAKAMFTLFQVMTFDSWSSKITRSIAEQHRFAELYFVSFVFFSAFVST
jgi:voltage-gated sodium channel